MAENSCGFLRGAGGSGDYDLVRILLALVAWLLVLANAVGGRAEGATSARVAVQPLEGPAGASLRQQIARLVRGHGFQVLTSIPRVAGTGQYLELARDHRLTAFIAADIEEHKTRQTLTILIWDGASGSVLSRWSATGSVKALSKTLARGFWKHLGPALEKAQAPPSNDLPPAAPMRIDASVVD